MRNWLRRGLQLLSLLLFGLILWWAGPEAWRQVLSGEPRRVLSAFLLFGAATALSAVRLRLVAHALAGRRLGTWRRFYYLNIAARAVGVVVPRTVSTFAGKPVALRTLGLSLKRSVWTVLVDNGFDLVLLTVLAVPSVLFLTERASAQGALAVALVLVLLLGLAAGLWWAGVARGLSRLLGRVTRILRLEAISPQLSEDAAAPLPPRATVLGALGLTLLLSSSLAACYYQISRAVGLAHPWLVFVAGFPVTQLSLVLAVTPGGIGILDAGWYGVLLLGGAPRQDALTFVVAQRAYVTVFVLVWAGIGTLLSLVAGE